VDLTVHDDGIDHLAAVVRDDVAEQPDAARVGIDLHDGDVDRARPRHGRHVVVGGGLEIGYHDARLGKGRDRRLDDPGQVHSRARGAAHEGAPVLDLDVLGRGLEEPRRRARQPGAHLAAGIGDRVARGHAAATGEGADAEWNRGGVAADDRHPVQRHAERVGGDLGEGRLVSLAG